MQALGALRDSKDVITVTDCLLAARWKDRPIKQEIQEGVHMGQNTHVELRALALHMQNKSDMG